MHFAWTKVNVYNAYNLSIKLSKIGHSKNLQKFREMYETLKTKFAMLTTIVV